MRAWLFTIMHNLYVNDVRRYHNGPSFVSLEQEHHNIPIDGARTDEALVLEELHAAMSSLPVNQRSILLMVSLEGMGYEQVAKITGVPVGTVMSRLSRARQQLRKVLSQPTPGQARVK